MIRGLEVARGAPIVSHHQFVDDTLIFYDAEMDPILNLKVTFLCFKAVLGLKVIFSKKEVIRVHLHDIQLDELAKAMGSKV